MYLITPNNYYSNFFFKSNFMVVENCKDGLSHLVLWLKSACLELILLHLCI